jgi:predicted ATPase
MITKIYADNFACLTNFTFQPKPGMNLLVGDNGSGKTWLFFLMASLRYLVIESKGVITFPRRFLTRWEKRTQQRFGVVMETQEGRVLEWDVVLEFDGSSDLPIIEHETVKARGQVVAEYDGRKSSLTLQGKDVPIPYQLESSLLSLRIDHPDLHAVRRLIEEWGLLKPLTESMQSTSTAPRSLNASGTNLPSSYRRALEVHQSSVPVLHERMSEIIPGFSHFSLEPLGAGEIKLIAQVSPKDMPLDGSYALGLEELSDGQRALAVLYHFIISFGRPGASMWIDEPDAHVSLRELQPWLQQVTRTVEERHLQAFIISHSPEVIDCLAADTAWLFERIDGGPTRVRPLPVDLDGGLKASEQLARGWTDAA